MQNRSLVRQGIGSLNAVDPTLNCTGGAACVASVIGPAVPQRDLAGHQLGHAVDEPQRVRNR